MTRTLDTLQGYAIVWNRRSRDLAARSESPRFERIPPGALTIAPTLFCDSHHLGALTAFAYARDGTARAWTDDRGVAFSAQLPSTTAGWDIFNGLREKRALGVSIEVEDLRYEPEPPDHVHVVQSATLRAISVMKPDAAMYADAVCWLASAAPATLPPHAEDARRHWRAPARAPVLHASARAKPLFNLAVVAQLPAPRRRVA
jgi:phage head maturation protease